MAVDLDVISAWSDKTKLASRDLRSDGVSLWGYKSFEIARHVAGSDYPWIAMSSNRFDRVINQHVSLAQDYSFHDYLVAELSSKTVRRRFVLQEPNWLWMYLNFWYSELPFLISVKIKKQAILFSNEALLIEAKKRGIIATLLHLSLYEYGEGVIEFSPDKTVVTHFWGDVGIIKSSVYPGAKCFCRTVKLFNLYRADLLSAAIVGSGNYDDNRWVTDLFSNFDLPYFSNPKDYFFNKRDGER